MVRIGPNELSIGDPALARQVLVVEDVSHGDDVEFWFDKAPTSLHPFRVLCAHAKSCLI